MMLVYGTTLTKLPFLDERSFIMKPIIGLQDYFVSKWQENLPDDDAEKYLGWYFFSYMGGVVHNSSSILMYYEDRYSYDETRGALDKMWYTLENISKYKAKDKVFEQMRYAAFNNLSLSYIKNAPIYWFYERKSIIEVHIIEDKQYFLDIDMMLKDTKKTDRYVLLFKWIGKMDEFYKTNKYKYIDSFCNIEKSLFLKEHIKNRDMLISLMNKKKFQQRKKTFYK